MNIKRKILLVRQLLYFAETIRNGKITRTAERNGIKTSNLSCLLKEFEQVSGVCLLNRKNDGVEPTTAGKELYELAVEFEQILNRLNIVQSRIKQSDNIKFYCPEWLIFDTEGFDFAKIELVDSIADCDVGLVEYDAEQKYLDAEITKVVMVNKELTIQLVVLCRNKNDNKAFKFYRYVVDNVL